MTRDPETQAAAAVTATALQICSGDPVAAHGALVQAIILLAGAQSDNNAVIDEWIGNAIASLRDSLTSDEERTTT